MRSFFCSFFSRQGLLHLRSRIFGQEVGRDALGNRYFHSPRKEKYPRREKWPHKEKSGATKAKTEAIKARRRPDSLRREARWVLYAQSPEASAVPAAWHAWLHHSGQPPEKQEATAPWMRPHRPNPSGTDQAIPPRGDLTRTTSRQAAGGDYQPWQPEEIPPPVRAKS